MPPVNALTLEEIHARENISVRPPPGGNQVLVEKPSNSGEGMQAFNKLLAVLESKKNVWHFTCSLGLLGYSFLCTFIEAIGRRASSFSSEVQLWATDASPECGHLEAG